MRNRSRDGSRENSSSAGRADAEDSEVIERASDLYSEWRNGEEEIAELEALISSEGKGRRIVLDLKELILVVREATNPS